MSYPKTIEHAKHYLVNIQVFGDRFREESPEDLHYLATSVEINYAGGSDFVHQKGNTIASAFATQPTVSVSVKCYMSEVDFAVLTSGIISEQQQILLSVGRLADSLIGDPTPDIPLETRLDHFGRERIIEPPRYFNRKSALMFEAIGFMKDAKISAISGEFVTVDFTLAVDEMNKIRLDDKFGTDGIPEFNT